MKEIFEALRPYQWYKNMLIFAGIVFAERFFEIDMWIRVFLAFFIFCGISSSVYIINDIFDLEFDKKHPKKRMRPIASGKLKVSKAIVLATALALFSLLSSFFLDYYFFLTVLLYFFLMLFYSKILKKIEIVDALVIGIGFVLRAFAGTLVIGVLISEWLILCTFLIAIFLAFGKRRHELLIGYEHRTVLKVYTPELLDHFLSAIVATTIISYSLYTFKNKIMMVTIPLVVFGLFRFYFLIYNNKEVAGNLELVTKDKPMIFDIFFWIILVVLILILT